jgi:dTDP-6-deoxy-L-talose 4-dehydrogenase [NAD(P)+]
VSARRRALVVGGTGFIGAAICRRLRARGYEVVALSRRGASDAPAGLPDSPFPDFGPALRHARLDLVSCADAEIDALLAAEHPDAVVNAAGVAWGCTEREMRDLNTVLVERLVAALGRTLPKARLVQLGSVHEYGAQPQGRILTESMVPRPTTAYGSAKLGATEEVLRAGRAGLVPGVVLRATNVVGAAAPPLSLAGRVAADLARAERTGAPAVLTLSPLRASRDFVDVDDVARAAALAADAGLSGEVLNIGSGRPVPVRAVVDTLVRISGLPATVLETAVEEAARGYRLDWQQPDIRRAGRLLGWSPVKTLDQSMRELWESARAAEYRAAGVGVVGAVGAVSAVGTASGAGPGNASGKDPAGMSGSDPRSSYTRDHMDRADSARSTGSQEGSSMLGADADRRDGARPRGLPQRSSAHSASGGGLQ